MSEVKQLPKRSEVPKSLTWDLTTIFKNDEQFFQKLAAMDEKIKEVSEQKGHLNDSAKTFLDAIESLLNLVREMEKLYVYAHLKNDQDTSDATYQGMYSKASSLATEVSAAIAWFEPEVMNLSEKKVEEYFSELPALLEYKHFIEDLLRGRAHVLSEKEENILAQAGEIFSAPSDIFSILNNADLQFPIVKDENGTDVQLSHGMYGKLLESPKREVREAAFKGLYQVYEQFQHTFAATLSSHVKMHNFTAKARKYPSARAASLENNHIPESVYDTLLSVVHDYLPSLHRYVALRKKLLRVDQLHMYDMYTPLLGEAPIKYSFEKAKEIALKALAPLGEDYLAIVKEAYDSRWIDVVENKGKRSGAYSSGCYDTNPYILLNWHDSLNELYTLVHEMGHSVHSYLTRKNQPYVYGDYSIFLAEIASTTNENLLTNYLLETEKDPKVRAYIINHYLDGFKGTIFRQTQFAEFEYHIHTEDNKGVPLTSDYMSKYYASLNAKYYGDVVEKDSEIALEWARIPHFYYNYYVYQYATGFSAATALSDRIVKQVPNALNDYLDYLKSGSSDYPIEVMKRAGVDMTEKEYLVEAMAVFDRRLNELEELLVNLT